ncbi:protein-methionine-sulfoxide reductase heme-binding subunit MsrQ [Rhodomicrobium vannielii ATCC 17100]|uniref:protein-methionine-sulfoxide reductase heme-binding subunit MsrQ n=1 Tax=Rhodomicrobium vannielii TaxID=1069 RepID=UPI00191A3B8D|nr:protein-methionine-sulfoxide reductase heme-binding subunit MsrQ [Rhodomicrobium vannielii]MBJ7533568.1 protein-methionine-sulfoxide reductase heme-binding subunit MsrQ [Rhodomicrobium vannielii ATCC 17100]
MTQPKASPRRAAQRAIGAFPRWPVYLVGALPGVWTFWLAVSDQLGADPVKTLEHMLGLWALRFLIASLAVTPLRRLGGPNLVRFRRALGLLAFFYACAHLLTWIVLDRGPDMAAILGDIVKRPYITLGMATFAILVPLAWTSNARTIKRMGGAAWQRLHRWVYLAAVLAIAHYLLSLKSWTLEPLAYAAAVAALLLFRVFSSVRGNRPQKPVETG